MSDPIRRHPTRWLPAATLAAASALVNAAHAAGTAYQVDTAEVTGPGACKVESWMSLAHNTDAIGAVSPACGFTLITPMELSSQFNRTRTDGEWGSSATPKLKAILVPSAIGRFGIAVAATASYDLITRENAAVTVTVPATLRLSNVVRVNLNLGWLWDRSVDGHSMTYGAGVDWRTPDNVFTITGEVFGQIGTPADPPSVILPRFQTGLRVRPIDEFSMDFIYGRNITGVNVHWFTIGTTVRFAPPEK
jgi:hypothetical protein